MSWLIALYARGGVAFTTGFTTIAKPHDGVRQMRAINCTDDGGESMPVEHGWRTPGIPGSLCPVQTQIAARNGHIGNNNG